MHAEDPGAFRFWRLSDWLGLALTIFAGVVIGWGISLGIEVLGLVLGWWGAEHSAQLRQQELARLHDTLHVTEGLSPYHWAQHGAAWGYRWSGIQALVDSLVEPSATSWLHPQHRQALRQLGAGLLIVVNITQLVGARLAIVVLSLGVFALAAVMGLIDGLVQRDLRRFGGGLESGFLYHHLKTGLKPLLIAPMLIYLTWPAPLSPTWVFVPPAIGLGVLVALTVAKFKKYL